MRKIITAWLSIGALALPLSACSSARPANAAGNSSITAPLNVAASPAASVTIPTPDSQGQQMIEKACTSLDDGAQAVRSASSANISDALNGLYAEVGSYQGILTYPQPGTDFDTLIAALKSAFTNNGSGPQLTGPVAPIQTALNKALADCQTQG